MCRHLRQCLGPQDIGSRSNGLRSGKLQSHSRQRNLTIILMRWCELSRNRQSQRHGRMTRGAMNSRASGSQTAHRFRNFLHQDTIKGYYFDNNGRHAVPRDFWPTPGADGVLETGIHWPYGRPNAWHEQRPSYQLFLMQSELEALLSDQPANKRPFPESKMPELVAAMSNLDERLNRQKQREALRKSPEFERYHLTDDVFRKAEKQMPRKPGRKPLRPEE